MSQDTNVFNRGQLESWACEFSGEEDVAGGRTVMFEIDGLTTKQLDDLHAVSGTTVLKVGDSSYVEENTKTHKNVLHVSPDDNFVVEEMDEYIDVRHYKNRQRRRNRRRLASSVGELNTLVIRVKDKKNNEPVLSAAKIEDDVFLDGSSLKSQYEACSHDAIKINQAQNDGFYATFNGDDYQGIVDVKVKYEAKKANIYKMPDDAVQLAANQYNGGTSLSNDFDLVLTCLPPGTKGNWIAYAYINHYLSVYNNEWCGYVSGLMHEVGHNVGLAHSGENGGEYSDGSGAMGYSSRKDDQKMCFNAAKAYQLGWFEDKTTEIDPLALPGGEVTYTLNGIADYGVGDGFIAIRLDYNGQILGGSDYYIGYNRATGMNSETREGANTVTVLRKTNNDRPWNSSRNGYGQSWLEAKLSQGDEYKMTLSGTDVKIKVLSINGMDARVKITGGVGGTAAPTGTPTPEPSQEPTTEPSQEPTPVPAPTTEPSQEPTGAPVITDAPSAEPTQDPTAEPSLEPTAVSPPTPRPTNFCKKKDKGDNFQSQVSGYTGTTMNCSSLGNMDEDDQIAICNGFYFDKKGKAKDKAVGDKLCIFTCNAVGVGKCAK